MQVRLDVIDEETIWYARQFVDRAPVRAIILANLDQAVIRSRIHETLNQRRFRQGSNRIELRHRPEIPRCIVAPGAPHDRLPHTVFVACQVTADGGPAVAIIIALPDALRCEVERL